MFIVPLPKIDETSADSLLKPKNSDPQMQNPDLEIDEEQFEEQSFVRSRRAILRLSANLLKAAGQRTDLAPFLFEAMHNAMTNLLEHGDERDLLLLEQWLDEENAD